MAPAANAPAAPVSGQLITLTPEQALDKIAHEWAGPIFFRRLEQYGVVPANDTEAAELLKLSMVLEVQEQQKQASAQSATANLVRRGLQRFGVNTQSADAEANALAKQSSENVLTNNPELMQAFMAAADHLN